MKNIVKYALSSMALAALAFGACQKDLNVEPSLDLNQPYALTSLDANGGTWKPLLLATGADITVAVPTDPTSAAYQTELAAVKGSLSRVSDEQKSQINHWNGNAVARWMQIASDIMAKYNLPPAPNADETYPIPTANNPAAYPYFPFANPPYASRSYAYLGAAMYDAMISAWHWKYQYNRPAPYKTDTGIAPLLPASDLPSYPSEDAVVAAVARTILTAMFPNEKGYLTALAEEHKNTRLWAGANVASDLTAGDALGTAVANKFLDRAKTDGMSKAVGTQTLWDSLAGDAQDRYGYHWNSLETPARPPMLPLFGRLKVWNIPSVEAVRPAEPPAVGSDVFNRDAEELKSLLKKPTNANRALANFWADGPGTYTPPGHWAIFSAQLVYKYKLNPLRSARVMAYVGTALEDAGISCWDTKYYYHYPRPAEAIPNFKTMIGVPNFPAYTSGHSTFSSAGATVLAHFFPQESADLETKAKDASESRIVSGIHYRFDCEVGLAAGKTIGQYAIDKAKLDGGE